MCPFEDLNTIDLFFIHWPWSFCCLIILTFLPGLYFSFHLFYSKFALTWIDALTCIVDLYCMTFVMFDLFYFQRCIDLYQLEIFYPLTLLPYLFDLYGLSFIHWQIFIHWPWSFCCWIVWPILFDHYPLAYFLSSIFFILNLLTCIVVWTLSINTIDCNIFFPLTLIFLLLDHFD